MNWKEILFPRCHLANPTGICAGGRARYNPLTTAEPAPFTTRFMLATVATVDKPRSPNKLRDMKVAITTSTKVTVAETEDVDSGRRGICCSGVDSTLNCLL